MGNEWFILQTVKEMKKNAKKWPISFSETSRGSGGGRRDYGWMVYHATHQKAIVIACATTTAQVARDET